MTTPESWPHLAGALEGTLADAFPADFLWGVATGAFQPNGMTREEYGRGPFILDQRESTPGKARGGETEEVAAQHYHLMGQDVALMGDLGVNAARFSISWSRIQPSSMGATHPDGMDFYDRLVDNLLERGIAPVATLFHADLPVHLRTNGGWRNRYTAYAFADYAEIVARRLGDRIERWITLSEPRCSTDPNNATGICTYGVRTASAAIAAHHMLLAHGLATSRLCEIAVRKASVGIALNLTPIYAADDRLETLDLQRRADMVHNRWFLDPIFRATYPDEVSALLDRVPSVLHAEDMAAIAAPLDFLGVNYYSRLLIRARESHGRRAGAKPPADRFEVVGPVLGSVYTDAGWEVYPDGLVDILMRVHRDYDIRSIAVTENGAAYADSWDGANRVEDRKRTEYLHKHIQALAVARLLGVPVDAYFAWTLTDNVEPAESHHRRFGLVHVDYPSQRRVVKDSGLWYRAFLETVRKSA